MAQISLYVDDAVLDDLRDRAAREGKSVSKLTAEIIEADRRSSAWPEGWFELFGSCPDFPEPDGSALDPALDEACDWFAGEQGGGARDVHA